MENWQAFLLGIMVAYMPALIFLGITLGRATDTDQERAAEKRPKGEAAPRR